MSSGASTSTMAGASCFSCAAISRLPAKDPLTVNSLRTTTLSDDGLVEEDVVVVVVVVDVAGGVFWARADNEAASEISPTAARRRPGRV